MATSFEKINLDEKLNQSECKDVIHMVIPLFLDLSSVDFHLINGICNLRNYKLSIETVEL